MQAVEQVLNQALIPEHAMTLSTNTFCGDLPTAMQGCSILVQFILRRLRHHRQFLRFCGVNLAIAQSGLCRRQLPRRIPESGLLCGARFESHPVPVGAGLLDADGITCLDTVPLEEVPDPAPLPEKPLRPVKVGHHHRGATPIDGNLARRRSRTV